jgi:hypothetical protein
MISAEAVLAWPPGTRARRELQPLIHAVLERADRLDALDAQARAFARRGYYQTLARSVAIRETLEEVLDAADREGALALPLKGCLLAFTVYPDPGMRPMGDVDVAVAPEAIAAVAGALVKAGYRVHGEGRRRFDLRHHHELLLERPNGPAVDLHARLLHELGADGSLDALYAHAIEVPLFGRARHAPSWEEHFVYLALHAAAHGFADSPLWLADLALVAPRLTAPDRVFEAARARRAVAAVHFAFAMVGRYLPSLVLPRAPTPGRWEVALRGAALALLLGRDPLARVPDARTSLLLRFALTDRPRDVARALADKIALRAHERWVERVVDPPYRA